MTKFADELIGIQLALVFFASSLALYWLVVRKKKKESAEWVPAALVRAYLDKVRTDEQEIRFKLFGEAPALSTGAPAPLAAALNTVTTVTDPALLKEVDALRAQLQVSDQRALEFDRLLNALKAEKATLEEKLKNAGTAAPSAAGAPSPEALKELEDLKARLQEYEVIEDDLANLKKFQKENEQLRQKVEQYEQGGTATVSAAAPAPEVKTVISGGEKAAPAMTLVSGGAGTPAPDAPAAAAPAAPAEPTAAPTPAPAPVAAAPAPETNTNVLQAVPAAAEAAPEKSAKQKEEELLSEFEKMLAS